ncbi:tRNA N6-adenosine threonylcarbamoyltransferase [Planctomycetes bacterium Poly30]|uniref:tRNA N6-adenosine threonylcarbamoyltransferase n=1 Tax=Saltatorellus ferox TaxID=2528018 RepID=A0A518F033_9BACT|nr:tRNA N6-adenosine threonylcarbamoyltransferase [Planctomycetes bacterium Poly30]
MNRSSADSQTARQLVLGIESSCDETAAAVVADGRDVLSNVVFSQAAEHAKFGGVVPEVAGRIHLDSIAPAIQQALDGAGIGLADLSAVAVTARPGLIGSLLVGLSAAKAISWTRGLPLVAVDHIEAHVYAATMESQADVRFPCIALVVSGGHTALYSVGSPRRMERIATTLDDAAGEAFDKVAWMLGLPYPGGPAISKLAESGNPEAIRFPRYTPKTPPGGSGGPRPIGFSFSGLKTAVLYHIRGGDALNPTPAPEAIEDRADIAASFEEAVADTLVTQTLRAAEQAGIDQVLVAGGVACNRRLRALMASRAEKKGIRSFFPSPAYCTDNAVMIAGLGWQHFHAGDVADLHLDAAPR